jgi:ACS family hexuronate transporter-like MFS transporter
MTRTTLASAPPQSRFRWVMCGLLFFATANNYLDRQTLGVLAPELIQRFGWTAKDYTEVVFWFQVGFALGFPITGRFLDAVGTRTGFALAVAIWSAASAMHGLVNSLAGFKIARAVLGFTQPSNMPAGVKMVAVWFPPSERALATGLFKGGSNLGAILVPVVVPWLFFTYGWRATFIVIGLSGFVWLIFWLRLYRAPGSAEGATTSTAVEAGSARVRWRVLICRRETWAYMNFKFMTDAIWHWYLAMLPLFLSQKFGLSLAKFGPPLIVVYLTAFGGSVGGGWLSSRWIAAGWEITRARKFAMLLCCLCTVPVVFVTRWDHLWGVILLVGLAHAAHQGLTSNLFATVADIFPARAVGTVVGLGGVAAQSGAALMTLATGWVLEKHGELTALFPVAGSAYVVAFLIFHWLVPRFEPLTLPQEAERATV